MQTTTMQLERTTHARLKKLKHEMTFDELITLILDLVTPEEIERAREIRQNAYERWQADVAERIRANRSNKRLF